MPLKYQKEIDDFELDIDCPGNVVAIQDGMQAYRWVYQPINNELNFLPNVVFDRLTNSTVNYAKMTAMKKCNRCGASFYTSLDKAKASFTQVNERLSEVLKLNYMHVAHGVFTEKDGVIKAVDEQGHFGFYENENCDLGTKFRIISEL